MAYSTPQIQNNSVAGGPALETAEWYSWLEGVNAFRYFSTQTMPAHGSHRRAMGPISVRREKRRRGYLWYAYRRVHGQLHKVYVGKGEDMSIARLDEVAAELNSRW
jgi:LuxR family maltose regulon positive regulatory protein